MIDLKERHDPATQPVSPRMEIFSVLSVSLPWGQAQFQTSWVSTPVGPKIPHDAKMATAAHDIYFYIYHSGEEKWSLLTAHTEEGRSFAFPLSLANSSSASLVLIVQNIFPLWPRDGIFFFLFSSRKLIILDLGVGSRLPISYHGEGWGWSPKRQL